MENTAKKDEKYSQIRKIITLTTFIIGIILIILNFYEKEGLFVIKQILQLGLYLGLGYIGIHAVGTNIKRDISFVMSAIILSATTIYLFKKTEYTLFPIFIFTAFLFFIIFCLGVLIKKSILEKKIWNSIGYIIIILIILATIYYGASVGEFPVPY